MRRCRHAISRRQYIPYNSTIYPLRSSGLLHTQAASLSAPLDYLLWLRFTLYESLFWLLSRRGMHRRSLAAGQMVMADGWFPHDGIWN